MKQEKCRELKEIKYFLSRVCFMKSKSIHKNTVADEHRKRFIKSVNMFR